MTAEAIVAAVAARGSDARDVRDAAHEACHALAWGVTKRWTRDNIHAKKPRRPSDGVAAEITARAVEALVCQRLGVPYDLPKWAMTCWLETMKNERISLPTDGWLEAAIRDRMTQKEVEQMADRVMALAHPARGTR